MPTSQKIAASSTAQGGQQLGPKERDAFDGAKLPPVSTPRVGVYVGPNSASSSEILQAFHQQQPDSALRKSGELSPAESHLKITRIRQRDLERERTKKIPHKGKVRIKTAKVAKPLPKDDL